MAGFFFLAGCTFQVGSVEMRLVYTADAAKNPLDDSLVRALRLTVAGPGLEPRSSEIRPAALGGTLPDVPAGPERQVTVEGLGSFGEVVSRGVSEPFDAGAGGGKLFVYFSLTGQFSGPPAGMGILDPDWPQRFRTLPLHRRFLHAAAGLASGQVLLSGGAQAPAAEDFAGPVTAPALQSMDLLDGFAGAFAADLPSALCEQGRYCLRADRARHLSVPLSDDEHVLLAGGEPADPQWPVELYETRSGTFLGTAPPQQGRTRLAVAAAGDRVVLAGGLESASGRLSNLVETFSGGRFTEWPEAALSEARAGAVAVAVGERAVLVIGGWKALGAPADWQASDAVDRIDFTGGQPAVTSFRLLRPRADHTAVRLSDGESGAVLVCGGRSSVAIVEGSCEIIDPDGSSSRPSAFSVDRWGHTCTVMGSGQVLVAGGFSQTAAPLRALGTALVLELPNRRELVLMLSPRAGHSASLLPNGMVALVGGVSQVQGSSVELPQFDYEFYNPTK